VRPLPVSPRVGRRGGGERFRQISLRERPLEKYESILIAERWLFKPFFQINLHKFAAKGTSSWFDLKYLPENRNVYPILLHICNMLAGCLILLIKTEHNIKLWILFIFFGFLLDFFVFSIVLFISFFKILKFPILKFKF
jgi:hypothetical protein